MSHVTRFTLIASVYWRKTRWPVVQVDSIDAVQTITFLAFADGQASVSFLVSLTSWPRPRPRLLQIGLETEIMSLDLW